MINLQQYREFRQRFGDEATEVIEQKEFEIDQLKLLIKMHEHRIEFLEKIYDMKSKTIS